MSARRILHVSTFAFPERIGGAERMVVELAAAQARRGDHVTLIASHDDAEMTSAIERGVVRRRFPLARSARGLAFLRAARRGCRAALATVANHSFDVVHVHQPATAAVGLAHPAALHLATFHAPWSGERGRRSGLADRLRAAGARRLDRSSVRGAARVVVLSRFAADLARTCAGVPPHELRVVAPGVDVDRFVPLAAPDRDAARRRFTFPPDAIVLLAVRRLVPRTGVDLLIDAVAHGSLASRDRGKLHLVIAGDGPERGALERRAADGGGAARVAFLGAVDDADLPRLLAAADLCVLPSRALEGFGLVTLEALACGTPVLATDVGANPEALGALAPRPRPCPPTAEGIARGIAEFVSGNDAWRDAAAAAAAMIHRNGSDWSWDAYAARISRVYDEAEHDCAIGTARTR